MHIGTFSNVVVSWINFVYFWLNNYISCLMKIQTCTILFHRIFKVSETDFNMFFFVCVFLSCSLSLSPRLSVFMACCIIVCRALACVCACHFLHCAFVFVLWSLSSQSVRACVSAWVSVCVSSRVKCQSHFAVITWGTKRRALLCNLSLPVAATQPLMYLGTHLPQLHRGF